MSRTITLEVTPTFSVVTVKMRFMSDEVEEVIGILGNSAAETRVLEMLERTPDAALVEIR